MRGILIASLVSAALWILLSMAWRLSFGPELEPIDTMARGFLVLIAMVGAELVSR